MFSSRTLEADLKGQYLSSSQYISPGCHAESYTRRQLCLPLNSVVTIRLGLQLPWQTVRQRFVPQARGGLMQMGTLGTNASGR